MANLACLLNKKGHSISGSDLDTFGPSAILLKKYRIKYFKDHDPAHLKKFKPDMVVIGNAIQRDNPSLEYVLNNSIPYQSMPEAIKSNLLENKQSIVITGTSGKTTTTALIAWILKEAGFKPTALVGGTMKNTDSGFMNGIGNYVVLEGDEYNSSFYDSCPKFIHYRPYIGVVNNIQSDHLDIYGNIENIIRAFGKFIKLIPGNGLTILNNQDKNSLSLRKELKSRLKTFSRDGDIWNSRIDTVKDGLSFVIFNGSKRLGRISSTLLGKHNVENILASVAVGLELKIPFKKIAEAVSSFKGVRRRLEVIFEKGGLKIINDFAHNPDKVRASLSALREHFPKHQIIAIFEPRTGSSRRKFFQNLYPESFKSADLVYIAEPFKKSALKKEEIFSSQQLAKDITRDGIKAYALKSTDDIITHLGRNLTQITLKPAIIVVVTSGEFEGIHQKLISLFK